MNVGELKEKLDELSDDLPVWVFVDDSFYDGPVETVEFENGCLKPFVAIGIGSKEDAPWGD